METLASSPIEWGAASRALPGQRTSGDRNVVKPFPDGVLIAALDGIGHGEEAAIAAAVAAATLEEHAAEPVTALVRRCHEALRATRGATMSVASFNVSRGLVAWLGVGNVEGVLLRRGFARAEAERSLLLRPGVLGLRLPSLEVEILPISAGDTLIFATDGIYTDFARGWARNWPPQKAAEKILAQHGRATDDALVLVARYLRDARESEPDRSKR
jgi:negative regulator of sigma-B (phosphoserine phosphatase)